MRLLPILFLVACPQGADKPEDVPDTDGDGLDDEEEADLGTDPENADSDFDLVGDADEVDGGTDPVDADSDDDTYLDGWEQIEGTDPLDADSRIYTGYWPYNVSKDEMEAGEMSGTARGSSTLPRFAYTDQHNETLDGFDYGLQGKLTIVDTSALWCYYCHELAKMLEGKRSFFDDYAGTYSWVEGLGPLIEDGTIQWITILTQDGNYDTISHREANTWYDEYPNPKIPVLADEEKEWEAWVNPTGFPTLMLVDENMKMVEFDRSDYTVVLNAAMEAVGE
ncbi:MAG: hypothetical protein ACOZNI_28690 [Myxococcota bacterium]